LADERPALPVRESPKPPPERISLGLSAINRAREVWLVAAGEEKAAAVASALNGGSEPAARVAGKEATRWLLDQAAAAAL
jgi:6-phosphogluconolactonase